MRHRTLEEHRKAMAEQRARREGRPLTRTQRIVSAITKAAERFVTAFRITRPEVQPGRSFNSIAEAARYRDDVWNSPSGHMPPAEWLRQERTDQWN